MKKVKVAELKKGDVFYHANRYWEVTAVLLTVVRAKCFMGPHGHTTSQLLRRIGDWSYIEKRLSVQLLVRDGEKV